MPVEVIATIGTTNLPGLLANEEMAKTVEPGALETCDGEQAFEAVKLVRTRAQRIPSCAQSICSPKGRIHLRRPPVIEFFVCSTATDHTFSIGDQPPIDANQCSGAMLVGASRPRREGAQ